jgi:hypothetical protein
MRYLVFFAAVSLTALSLLAQAPKKSPRPGEAERAIVEQIRTLRSVPDGERGTVTKRLAMEIRNLPKASANRLSLANSESLYRRRFRT